jgi:restriction endonuclease S subunit
LEGLEVSEVKFSGVDLGDRIDAEFFSKFDLGTQNLLLKRGSVELRDFGTFVASAFYPAATHLYAAGDMPFIRCVDCVNFPVITKHQDELFERIPTEFAEESGGINFLEKGDIVITKVGTPSYASMVSEHEKVALSRTVMGLKNIKKINPTYLLMYLRSKFGFSQLQRQRELTIQYQLTLERTKRVQVFVPTLSFQEKTASFSTAAEKKIALSRTAYALAESLLLETLGLSNFKPSAEAVNIKLFKDSFGTSGRLDAEYYQPKYEQMLAHISQLPHAALGNLVDIQKSIEPGSDAYSDDAQGLPFLRVADYSKQGITPPQVRLSENFVRDNTEKLAALKPKKESILFSKDGSVGQAYCLREDADFITSGAILHLSVKDKTQVLPDYLTLTLNSKVVQQQAERDAGGSIILHWRKEEIENVLVPIVDMAIQQKIATQIQDSVALKAESERLLEVAKRAVEIAIEQDEEAGMTYLREHASKAII